MKKIFLTMALAIGLMASAQVKIGTAPETINDASLLELESSTQGLLLPRVALVNTTTRTLVGSASIQGMTVYNTANTGDVTEGLYTHNGTKWVKVGASTPSFQIQKSRVHADNAAIVWATDDYSVVTTGLGGTSKLLLPDATTLPNNAVRCVSANGTGNAGWDPAAVSGVTRGANNLPTTVSSASGFCFITISGQWYILSGR